MNQLENYLQLAQIEFAASMEKFPPDSHSFRLLQTRKKVLDSITSEIRFINAITDLSY